jgi:hypothetical protein
MGRGTKPIEPIGGLNSYNSAQRWVLARLPTTMTGPATTFSTSADKTTRARARQLQIPR